MSNNQRTNVVSYMLHHSSGRHNFGVVKPEQKDPFIASQQETTPSSDGSIQKRTHEAIKAATKSNVETAGTKRERKSIIQHINITCDGCFKSPIIGDRYKCMFCPNIDFCQDCQSLTNHRHDSKHPLICIRDSTLYTSSIYIQNVSQLIHLNTRCVYCSVSPIIGNRYQCIPCAMNFCEKCEFLCLHDISHKRSKIILPE